MATADRYQQLAQESSDKAGVLILAYDGHVGTTIHDTHLHGVLKVFAEFAILTQELQRFFLVL